MHVDMMGARPNMVVSSTLVNLKNGLEKLKQEIQAAQEKERLEELVAEQAGEHASAEARPTTKAAADAKGRRALSKLEREAGKRLMRLGSRAVLQLCGMCCWLGQRLCDVQSGCRHGASQSLDMHGH